MSMLLLALPLLAAPLVYAGRRWLPAQLQGGLLAALMAALFVAFLSRLPEVTAGTPIEESLPWIPQLGLTLSIYIDGLALLFVLLVTGIGAAVMLYAGAYFDDRDEAGRFLALLIAFSGAMLLLVTAGSVLLLFIGWEGTSIISFLLISFKSKSQDARAGALQALMITGGGGLALLVGLLLLAGATGSADLARILTSADALREHPWASGIIVLLALGAFSKSAQFPLHFWLPGAMSAPTPASAFLHSATMVKAGIYLLARFAPVLGDSALWTTLLTGFGLATFCIGAALALWQRDLKGILAYTTISQLGALVALIGLPHGEGLKAAAIGVIGHALYKGTLFLVAGAIDHATGTRDITRLGGLRGTLPGYAGVTALAALSMAGVPPLLGFVAKELMLDGFGEQPLLLALVVLGAALQVVSALRLSWDVFFAPAPPVHNDHDAHESHGHALPRLLLAGPAALAGASLLFGLGISPLLSGLIGAVLGKTVSLYLLPPQINLAFLMSLTALGAGGVLFALRRRWLGWQPPLPSAAAIYRRVVGLVERAGDALLTTQGGHIRYYLSAILIAVVALLATAIPRIDLSVINWTVTIVNAQDALKVVLLGLALLTTLLSVLFRQHLAAALALGVAGYSIGGIFLLEPAPDVALVQFVVETLATVLIILILTRTSQRERVRAMARMWTQSRGGIARDALIAGAVGSVMAVFALAAISTRPTPNALATGYLQNALPQAGVTDVVAAIVTDFRGMDTLIEITVFGMAALGVLTLLARPKPGRTMALFGRPAAGATSEPKDALQEDAERPETIVYRSRFVDPLTRLAARLALPFSLLIGIGHLLYAGFAPGDGFTAGVIIGLGIASWFVVFGYEETRSMLPWLRPVQFIGLGLTIAFVNALLPVLFGRSFMALTSVQGFSFADIKLASTVIFEIGICLTVLGGVSTIVQAISHPKEVESL
jgi:NADH:ubiquinone oxidoreductase subunit 5 (subunit L)/multisubunit Na+/H+ antiporter MnhA subunit